eukprot:jgi/Chrzof1/6125/Cz17g10200.t1
MLAGIGCNFVSEQRCAYGLTNVLRPTVPFLVGSYASRLTSEPQQQQLLLENGQLSLRQKASNVKGKVISQAELQKRLPSWFIVEDAMDRMLLDMANQDFITADNIADVQIFRTQQRDLAKQFLDRGAWARFLELQQDMMLCMWEKSRSFGHDHGLIEYLLVQVALADVSKTFKSSTVDATAVSPGASGDVAKPLGKRAKHFDKNGKECCWLNMHGGCKYGSGCSRDDQSMPPKFGSQQQLGSLQQLGHQSPVVQSTGFVHPLLDDLEFNQQQIEHLALSSYPALVYDLVKQYPMQDLLQQHGAECLVADSHFDGDDVDWHLGAAMFEARWLDDHVDLPSVPCKHPSLFKVSDPAVATSAQVLSDADWKCSPLGPWIDQVKSAWPLKSDAFRQVFSHDQDCEFLFKVVEQGVPISDCFSSQPAFHCKNYDISPALWPAAAASFEEQLKLKEVVTSPTGVASPFVHSIAAIPKQGKLDRARIIHDFSRPSGAAVNDSIHHFSLPFLRVHDLCDMAVPGGWLCKVDVRSYFHHFGVFPEHWPLLAFNMPLADGSLKEVWGSRMLFGLRNGPEVATRFSDAIVRLLRQMGWQCSASLLDDFCIMHANKMHCQLGWHFLLALLVHLGFQPQLLPGKSCPPAQQHVVLGLLFDLQQFTVSLCEPRVQALQSLLSGCLSARTIKFRDLQSVVGKLQWSSWVLHGGSLFLNQIRRCGRHAKKPHHFCHFDASAVACLQWWHQALQLYNGQQQLLGASWVPWHRFMTDASGTWDCDQPGVGIYLDGAFIGMSYAQLVAAGVEGIPEWDAPIQLWELFAVVLAARLFGEYLKGSCRLLAVDNSNVHAWLSKGTVKGQVCYLQALRYLKELFHLSVLHDFRIRSHLVRSKGNPLADALSRGALRGFGALMGDWMAGHGDAGGCLGMAGWLG